MEIHVPARNNNPRNGEDVDRRDQSIRRFCFTYQLEPQEVFQMPDYHRFLRYVWQEEAAPTTGQRHIQGYAEIDTGKDLVTGRTKGPVKFRTVQRFMPQGTHIESARGTYAENYAYCTKTGPGGRIDGGQFGEFGDWAQKGQGRRSDSIIVAEALKAEPDFTKVLDPYPINALNRLKVVDEHTSFALRYLKNMELLHAMFHLQKMKRFLKPEETDFRWYYGDSGSGKTRSVYAEFKHERIYTKTSNNKWWDNYNPTVHDVVIIDDYRSNRELPYENLLNILDLYPYQCEVKGLRGGLPLMAKIIIVTSNKMPHEIWPFDEHLESSVLPNGKIKWTPMMRRVHSKLKRIDDDGDVPVDVNDYLPDVNEGKQEEEQITNTPPAALDILPKDIVPARLVGADIDLTEDLDLTKSDDELELEDV